jgi:hypothetical protein
MIAFDLEEEAEEREELIKFLLPAPSSTASRNIGEMRP